MNVSSAPGFGAIPRGGYQKFHFNYFTIAQILINIIFVPIRKAAFERRLWLLLTFTLSSVLPQTRHILNLR